MSCRAVRLLARRWCSSCGRRPRMRRGWWFTVAAGAAILVPALPALGPAAQAGTAVPAGARAIGPGGGRTGLAAGNPFCQGLGKRYQASAGAQMFCFGEQPTVGGQPSGGAGPGTAGVPRNVDAANPAEDVSPAGARLYGQSETSVAAAGRYVVEAWNDSTSFASTCTARDNKAEGTGLGF